MATNPNAGKTTVVQDTEDSTEISNNAQNQIAQLPNNVIPPINSDKNVEDISADVFDGFEPEYKSCDHCNKLEPIDNITESDDHSLCIDCAAQFYTDDFRRHLKGDNVMAIHDSNNRYYRIRIISNLVGTIHAPIAHIEWTNFSDSNNKLIQESISRKRIATYDHRLIDLDLESAKYLMESLRPDQDRNEQKNGEEIKDKSDKEFIAQLRNPNSDIHKIFVMISESAKHGVQGSSEKGSNELIGHLLEESRMETMTTKFRIPFPTSQITLFKYVADVEQYTKDNILISNIRLFREILTHAPRGVQQLFARHKQQLWHEYAQVQRQAGIAVVDAAVHNKTVHTREEWTKFIISHLQIHPHREDFNIILKLIRIMRNEHPVKAYQRIRGYFDQVRITIEIINKTRADNNQLTPFSAEEIAQFMFRTFVYHNADPHYDNDGRLNIKIRLKINKKYRDNGIIDLDKFETYLETVATDLIGKSSTTDNREGYHWERIKNICTVFSLTNTGLHKKRARRLLDLKPDKPRNGSDQDSKKDGRKPRGRGNRYKKGKRDEHTYNNDRGYDKDTTDTNDCRYGHKCRHLANGTCAKVHPRGHTDQYKDSSKRPCRFGQNCRDFKANKCTYYHELQWMPKTGNGDGKPWKKPWKKPDNRGNGGTDTRKPYNPYKNTNADNSHRNIGLSKTGKANLGTLVSILNTGTIATANALGMQSSTNTETMDICTASEESETKKKKRKLRFGKDITINPKKKRKIAHRNGNNTSNNVLAMTQRKKLRKDMKEQASILNHTKENIGKLLQMDRLITTDGPINDDSFDSFKIQFEVPLDKQQKRPQKGRD